MNFKELEILGKNRHLCPFPQTPFNLNATYGSYNHFKANNCLANGQREASVQ